MVALRPVVTLMVGVVDGIERQRVGTGDDVIGNIEGEFADDPVGIKGDGDAGGGVEGGGGAVAGGHDAGLPTVTGCQLAVSLQFPSEVDVQVPLAPAMTSEPVPVKYEP